VRRRPLLAAGLATPLLTLGSCRAGGPTGAPPRTPAAARSRPGPWPELRGQLTAQQVVDSVGVNVHLAFTDTTYGRYDTLVRPRLLESGIRHVRDLVLTEGVDGDSTYYQRIRDLAGQGIGFTLLADLPNEDGPGTDPRRLAEVQEWCGGSVEAFEGINEPGQRGIPQWPVRTRAAQAAMAEVVRSTPSLAGVRLIAPSMVTREQAESLGQVAPWSDLANVHPYPGDARPETRGDGPDGEGGLPYARRQIGQRVAPGRPVVSTENGYATSPVEGQDTRADAGLSERAAGVYIPRMLLHHVSVGVVRTYLYELLSQADAPQDPEANFGLVRYDGSPTPAFRAVASLLALLRAEDGSGRRLSASDDPEVSWTVAGETADLVEVPIRVTPGHFLLALWREVDVWDREADVDLPLLPATVRASSSGFRLEGVVQQEVDGAFVERAASTQDVAVDGRVTLLRFRR